MSSHLFTAMSDLWLLGKTLLEPHHTSHGRVGTPSLSSKIHTGTVRAPEPPHVQRPFLSDYRRSTAGCGYQLSQHILVVIVT